MPAIRVPTPAERSGLVWKAASGLSGLADYTWRGVCWPN